jgi:hypothetical protein
LKLEQRFIDTPNSEIHYLVAIACHAIVMRGFQDLANESSMSAGELKQLLRLLPQAPTLDAPLIASLKFEFQSFVLPRLPDPYLGSAKPSHKNPEVSRSEDSNEVADPATGYPPSNYDAMETTQLVGDLLKFELESANGSFKDRSPTIRLILDQAEHGLPLAPDPELKDGWQKKWEWFKYRYLANNTHNFFGRASVVNQFGLESILEASDRYRNNQNMTRVLIASKLYRASHSGTLPPSKHEFIPILGSWPIDLFSGKPLVYNSKKQIIYSVGRNLKDDGGDIFGTSFGQKDTGLSL